MNDALLAENRSKRGQITTEEKKSFSKKPVDDLLQLLTSPTPSDRTGAAYALGNVEPQVVVEPLCQQLAVEKQLYCRIAIADALVNIGSPAVPWLIGLLGKIGSNQEFGLPTKGFLKTSYPLPRDIAARTLCRMGKPASVELRSFIEHSETLFAIEQAIDAFGHIAFTSRSKSTAQPLIQATKRFPDDKMITLKVARCLSAFGHDSDAQHFLAATLQSAEIGLQFEAARSMVLAGIDLPDIQFPLAVQEFVEKLQKKASSQPHRY